MDEVYAKIIFDFVSIETFTLNQTRELLESYREKPNFTDILNKVIQKLENLIEIFTNEKHAEDIINNLEQKIAICKKYQRIKQDENDELLPFEQEGKKYKIFFTGKAPDDIRDYIKQHKTKLASLIRKIDNLANGNTIGSEPIRHVNEQEKNRKKGVNFQRIWFGSDYRIAYFIEGNNLCIIGIDKKTGKDDNYTRYDSVADQIEFIRDKIQKLEKGSLEKEDDHFETIDLLSDKYHDKTIPSDDVLTEELEDEIEIPANGVIASQSDDKKETINTNNQEPMTEHDKKEGLSERETIDPTKKDKIVEIGDVVKLTIIVENNGESEKDKLDTRQKVKYIQIVDDKKERAHVENLMIHYIGPNDLLAQQTLHHKIGYISEYYGQRATAGRAEKKYMFAIDDIISYDEVKVKPIEEQSEKPREVLTIKPKEEEKPVMPSNIDKTIEQKRKEEEAAIVSLRQECDAIKKYTEELSKLIPECIKLAKEITNLNSQIFEYYGAKVKIEFDSEIFTTCLEIISNNPSQEEIRYVFDVITKHYEKLLKQKTSLEEIVESSKKRHDEQQQLLEERKEALKHINQLLKDGIDSNTPQEPNPDNGFNKH